MKKIDKIILSIFCIGFIIALPQIPAVQYQEIKDTLENNQIVPTTWIQLIDKNKEKSTPFTYSYGIILNLLLKIISFMLSLLISVIGMISGLIKTVFSLAINLVKNIIIKLFNLGTILEGVLNIIANIISGIFGIFMDVIVNILQIINNIIKNLITPSFESLQ